MPTVSVVIPAYNSARFIAQTLGSVIAQSFADFEILVVDDGSTDDTAAIAGRVSPRVNVIRQSNGGIAAARNTGLAAAGGDFVAFLDHDDIWHPQKLEAQIECFRRNPKVGLVYGEFNRWEEGSAPTFPPEPLDPSLLDEDRSGWIYHKLLLTNWVLFSTALFRRESVKAIGLFDAALPPADDWDFAIRASWLFPFAKMRQVVALYRVHPGQTSRVVAARNLEAEFRERTLKKFGYVGPDGSPADRHAVRERLIRSHLSFGADHLSRGDPRIATSSFFKALQVKPLSASAIAHLAAAIAKVATTTLAGVLSPERPRR